MDAMKRKNSVLRNLVANELWIARKMLLHSKEGLRKGKDTHNAPAFMYEAGYQSAARNRIDSIRYMLMLMRVYS